MKNTMQLKHMKLLTSTEYILVCPAVSFSTYPVQPRSRLVGGNVPFTLVFSPANHSMLTFPTCSDKQQYSD